MSADVVPRSREQVNWAVVVELARVITVAKQAISDGRPLSAAEIVTLMEARVIELRQEGARE